MAEQQDRILGYFLEEASEHLQTIEQGLRKLPETAKQPSAIRELFRAAHSIKGSAAMLGLRDTQKVADCFEANFKLLKDNPQIEIDSQLQSLFLGSFGFLQASIQAVRTSADPYDRDPTALEPVGDPVFAELRSHLQQLLTASEPADPQQPELAQSDRDPAIAQVFGEYVKRKLDELLDLCLQPDAGDTRAQMQQICQKVGKLGENFEFLEWTNLLAACRLAIANPANSLPQLGETIGMALKQAQILVLSDRAQEIKIPADLEVAIAPHNRAVADAGTAALSVEGTTWSLDAPTQTTERLAPAPDLISLDNTTVPMSADADFDLEAMELNEFMNLLGDDMPTEGTWMTEDDFFESATAQNTAAATTASLAQPAPSAVESLLAESERELVLAMSYEGSNAATAESECDFLELWPETFNEEQSLPLYSDLDLLSPTTGTASPLTNRQLSPDLAISTELGDLPAPDFNLDRPMSDLFPAEALDISDTQVPSSGEDIDLNSLLQNSAELAANDFHPDFPDALAQPADELEAVATPEVEIGAERELVTSDRPEESGTADFGLDLFAADVELPTMDDAGSVFNSITLSSSLDFEPELTDAGAIERQASDSLHLEPIGGELPNELPAAALDLFEFPASDAAAANLDDLFGDGFVDRAPADALQSIDLVSDLSVTADESAPGLEPDPQAKIGAFSSNDLSDLDLSPLGANDSVGFASDLSVDPQTAEMMIEEDSIDAELGNVFADLDVDFLANLEPAGNFAADADAFAELHAAATVMDVADDRPEGVESLGETTAEAMPDLVTSTSTESTDVAAAAIVDLDFADEFELLPDVAASEASSFDLNLDSIADEAMLPAEPAAAPANDAADLNWDFDLPGTENLGMGNELAEFDLFANAELETIDDRQAAVGNSEPLDLDNLGFDNIDETPIGNSEPIAPDAGFANELENLNFDLDLPAAAEIESAAPDLGSEIDNLDFAGFDLGLPAAEGVAADSIDSKIDGLALDLDVPAKAAAELAEIDAEGTAMMDDLDAEGTAFMEDLDPKSIDLQAIDAAGLNLADLTPAQTTELSDLPNLDDLNTDPIGLDAGFANEGLDLNLDNLAELPNLDDLNTDAIGLDTGFANEGSDLNLDNLSDLPNLDDLNADFDNLSIEAPSAELPDLGGLDDLVGTAALGLGATAAVSGMAALSDLDDLVGAPAPADNLGDLDALLGAPADPPATPQPADKPAIQRKPKEARKFDQTMKVSVKHLDNLNNLVGELVVNRNTLEQDQNRMRQFVEKLLSEVQKLNEVGKRMQDLYERSLMENSLIASRQQSKPATPATTQMANPEDLGNSGNLIEYDPLEMDRFTPIHLLSQKMIELTVRVRESTADIEFVVDGSTEVTRTLRQITSQLQEDLSKSRMLPFAQTADRLQRGVRDNGLRYGKQIELVVDGRDTPIDKVILESLAEPLTHMANNAIAHGIEDPETRTALGKPPEGKITLRAIHQGNQTIISMSDDGAGIDTERVKQKAIEKGIITAQQAAAMSKAEAYDLLFLPSFSTKDQADDLAGRGVGMDVVRTSINEIRGTISTESQLGVGTTFTIRLPLALSIAKALIAVDNKISIAFPMDGIEDTQDISPEQIQVDSEGRQCIFWRDELMPFTPLAELLEYNRPLPRNNFYGANDEDNDLISILILRTDGQFTAVQVDKLGGDREIVIKPLQGPAAKPLGIAGATVLGDGRIVPIADVMELIALAKGTLTRQVWAQGTDKMVLPTEELRESSVLIVDDSITVRELLSLTFKRAGYRVEQARDGQEAWDKLRAGLPCDIVFCDIEMPRMDGLEFLSRIQKDPALSKLPVAMLTSRGSDRHRQIASQLGASGYFIKPYLEEALLDAAKRMIGGEVLEIV